MQGFIQDLMARLSVNFYATKQQELHVAAMPDPVEEIKKAVEKELHKGLYPDFLREIKI